MPAGGGFGFDGGKKRLELPKGFKPSETVPTPPIFIDNEPTKVVNLDGRDNAFGNKMVTQHTLQKKEACCGPCSQPLMYMPDEYAVAKGPAKDTSQVVLTGKYLHTEDCGMCGFGYLCPMISQFCCYKDTSTFEFQAPGGGSPYVVKPGAVATTSDKRVLYTIEVDGTVVATAYDNSMPICEKAYKMCCSGKFTEYPVELRNSAGEAVLTKRNHFTGCCGIWPLCLACACVPLCDVCVQCGLSCGCPCPPDCAEMCCGRCQACCSLEGCKIKCAECCSCQRCQKCCSLEGCKAQCASCCKCPSCDCSKCIECCKFKCPAICLASCGCFIPICCGGSCCIGGCCATHSWMEPIPTDTDSFYGPREVKEDTIYATISHQMNIEYTQKWGCCRSSQVSPIYHSTVDMTKSYKAAEWQTLLAWLGFRHHIGYTMGIYGKPK